MCIRDRSIVGASSSATNALQVTRNLAGNLQGVVGVGTTVFRYDLTSATITVDQQGGGSVGAGATGMFVSSTVGINTIGVGTGNIIRLGTELIGIGETVDAGTNFVGFSTRGLDNTTAGSHNDGATVRVYTNAGAATTIREAADGTTTNLAVNAIAGFQGNDLGRLCLLYTSDAADE